MALYSIFYQCSSKSKVMKSVLERSGAVSRKKQDDVQMHISFFMILFFLIMGVASLFVLINSPA
jgi:hypothetical protein